MNIELVEPADQAGYYKVSAPTSSEIYAMCIESDTCDQFAKWLCVQAGVAFPPTQG